MSTPKGAGQHPFFNSVWGWKGLVDDTRSVGLSLPSSILFKTLPAFVIEITFQMSKMYRRACGSA